MFHVEHSKVKRGNIHRMATSGGKLGAKEIEALLRPHILDASAVPLKLYSQLEIYLELLLKWNARINLTSIREPEEILRRHFGESLFAAQHIPAQSPGECVTLLDFGSGAGFPGLPIQLLRPDIRVTLAESQNKKAAFLREALRALGLQAEVWGGRVEAMPASACFDIVTLRAVDNMDAAVAAASHRAARQMLLLTTAGHSPAAPAGFLARQPIPVPAAREQQLLWMDRTAAPV
jgi:16S rRNA (guanine527-N7)-methyltransferase